MLCVENETSYGKRKRHCFSFAAPAPRPRLLRAPVLDTGDERSGRELVTAGRASPRGSARDRRRLRITRSVPKAGADPSTALRAGGAATPARRFTPTVDPLHPFGCGSAAPCESVAPKKSGGPFRSRRFPLRTTPSFYQLNLKRTWMLRGSMFWVDTVEGMTLPKLALPVEVLMLSRP
jgi:hypothetical protein